MFHMQYYTNATSINVSFCRLSAGKTHYHSLWTFWGILLETECWTKETWSNLGRSFSHSYAYKIRNLTLKFSFCLLHNLHEITRFSPAICTVKISPYFCCKDSKNLEGSFRKSKAFPKKGIQPLTNGGSPGLLKKQPNKEKKSQLTHAWKIPVCWIQWCSIIDLAQFCIYKLLCNT